MDEKQRQVMAQCKAVAYLAQAVNNLYMDLALMHATGAAADLADIHGNRTARLMEYLGQHLNGIDAVQSEDKWLRPIFERAHQMFPQKREG